MVTKNLAGLHSAYTFLITVVTMLFVTGTVGFVTAGFFENLFSLDLFGEYTLITLFAICIVILGVGRYRVFDSLITVIAIVLVVSTTSAVLFASYNGPTDPVPDFIPADLWTVPGLFFLLALMGWMPTAIDLSTWNSLWTLERTKQTKYLPKLGETLFEFKLAYIITGILAVMFVTLGAFIFYGSDEVLPNNNSLFANKIITLYTTTIGEWSYVIIAASAFTIVFGTILAVLDGYSRSLQRTVELLFSRQEHTIHAKFRLLYVIFLIAITGGSFVVVSHFQNNLKELVDFATIL